MFDLTGIFSNTDNTIYIDDCCHLNNLGNQIMANAVVDNIGLYQEQAFR